MATPEYLVRVYEYGCGRDALRGLETAIEQMRRRNELWNRMVEIDKAIRKKMEPLLFAKAQEEELRALRLRLKELQGRSRNQQTSDPNQRPATEVDTQAAIASVRETLAEVKRARKDNADRNRQALRELDAERIRLVREAQSQAGLYWANRIEIQGWYDTARVLAMRSGRQLRSRHWDGTGMVTVYFPLGLSAGSVFAKSGKLQVDPIPEAAWTSPNRATRRQLSRTRVRIRVLANADRSPVWLELPLIMHRPLPEGPTIRWASVLRERVGLSWRHRLLLTVREPLPVRNEGEDQAVGIALGWRIVPTGLRVAYWCDQDGRSGELILTQKDLAAFKQIDSLDAAIAAAHLNVRSFLGSFVETDSLHDSWILRAREGVDSEAPRTLVRFFRQWQAERFPGDDAAFATVQAWYKQHLHLWMWQANLRDQLIRRRRDIYRVFAAEIARRYNRVFLNELPLARLARKVTPGHGRENNDSHYRVIASVSVLLQIVMSACEKKGVAVTKIDCTQSAKSCHACGAVEDSNDAAGVMHRCPCCGTTWDLDENVALNLLKDQNAPSAIPAETPGSRPFSEGLQRPAGTSTKENPL